jgi:histidinol-phosphate aminotransferase
MHCSLPTAKPYLASIQPYKAGKTARDPNIAPIKLSSNENSYGPSPNALAAYREAANSLHRYAESSCLALREALAQMHGGTPEHYVCGAGSDELIGLLIHAYAGSGDEVLFPEHAFLMYSIYTRSAGATPITAPETNRRADVDALLACVTERTKIVFLANPNNPTGTYLPAPEVQRLRAHLPSHIILALDGAYTECVDATDYDDGIGDALNTPNVVVLRTFSKLYGLPSLRLGWMCADMRITDAIHRMRSPFNVNGVAQIVGLAALHDQAYLQQQRTLMLQQRAWLTEALRALGLHVAASQGNFVLADAGTREEAVRLIAGLEAQHIYVRDVASYHLPTCLRVTIGKVEENQRFLEALTELRS